MAELFLHSFTSLHPFGHYPIFCLHHLYPGIGDLESSIQTYDILPNLTLNAYDFMRCMRLMEG